MTWGLAPHSPILNKGNNNSSLGARPHFAYSYAGRRGVNLKMATMYCVKCRQKRDVENPEHVTMKNGKPAMKGKCPVCGTGMYKIGKA